MKVRVASVLSLAGVLAAGSAAAVVNTQVLQPSAPVAAPNAAADTITTDPLGTNQPTPGPATQASYRVGEAGAVLLDTSGDVLTVVSATPGGGWTVASVTPTGETITVAFQQGTRLVTFTASFFSGVVATSVDTSDLAVATPGTQAGGDDDGGQNGGTGPTTSGPGTTAPRTTVDDNSDDDDDDIDDDD